MHCKIFKDYGFPDADYDFDAGRDGSNQPVVNFRAPGRGLQMIDLNGASQIKKKSKSAGDAEGASLFDQLIKDAQRGLATPGKGDVRGSAAQPGPQSALDDSGSDPFHRAHRRPSF